MTRAKRVQGTRGRLYQASLRQVATNLHEDGLDHVATRQPFPPREQPPSSLQQKSIPDRADLGLDEGRDQRIGAVLVTGEDGRLTGLFTGRDVVGRVAAEALDPATTQLGSVMTLEPDALRPDGLAIDALRMMHAGGYRHLPILDGKRIVGIVSRGDFNCSEETRFDEETGFWEIM